MAKTYTWEEIKSLINKELKKTKHILTYGTIGSCNIEHDIDTIITKKSTSSTADFYREVHLLFGELNNYLKKKHNAKLICFTSAEEEAIILADGKPNDLLIQSMIYTSFNQIKGHWLPYMFENESLITLLKLEYKTLLGDSKNLFSKNFSQKLKMDPILLYLAEYCNKINSNYSEKNLLRIMNFEFEYILRKRLGLESMKARNEKEVREVFYRICDILDG